MSLDISGILSDWPYEDGQITVRRIRSDDGREMVQLRLDLGILQMELDGRPDGKKPHGKESLLDYYEAELRRHRLRNDGDEESFELNELACEALRSEGVMYYHRYLACFILGEYDRVRRDATRNLRLFDFFLEYAAEEGDRYICEQYRPYVLMMLCRADANIALRKKGPRAALRVVRRGVRDIDEFYRSFDQAELTDASGEVAILKAMSRKIESMIPVDPMSKLRRELSKAVREERYEDAADLRDKLRSQAPHAAQRRRRS